MSIEAPADGNPYHGMLKPAPPANDGASVEAPVAGLRYNAGKTRYDLLPADGLHELADVYTIGARKYADRNWEKGLVWMETFGCLQRHAWAWARGEDHDPETGKHHMAHVAWNAVALLVFAIRGIGRDDRPKLVKV